MRGLAAAEVAELGYEMVLGNTFHLFIDPGADYVRDMGGLHAFMGWERPIITDSGGFQVFSMGHGSVAEEIKRRRGESRSRVLAIDEEGVRFRSYTDGSERFMGPETSLEVQAALGSDIALAFDECTPFHVERDYTRSAMRRTHRWLDRCVAWHSEHAPDGQALYGIVQGGVEEDLRAESAAYVSSSGTPGIAIGGSLGQDKEQMRQVLGWSLRDLPGRSPPSPAGHRRRGRHRARGGHGRGQLRLRDSHPPGPPWHRPGAQPRTPLAAGPDKGRSARAGGAAGGRLPVHGLPRP